VNKDNIGRDANNICLTSKQRRVVTYKDDDFDQYGNVPGVSQLSTCLVALVHCKDGC
jgi:hypothetical protein